MKALALWILAVSTTALWAQPTNSSPKPSAEISPAAVLTTMKLVADWQLANPSPTAGRYKENTWTYGALYTGIMALDEIAGTPKYRDAMVTMGQKFNWQLGPRPYHADDHCVGQTYLELYLKDRDTVRASTLRSPRNQSYRDLHLKKADPAMLDPVRARFDFILAHPATNVLDFKTPHAGDRWSWCDALFMAPPAWIRLWKATGDQRYLDFMDSEWRATSDFLYDTNEHLFFRDSTYADSRQGGIVYRKREANGAKIFWSRGNGWVLAGLARVLKYLPPEHPHRKFYETQFQEMAAKIASLQQADGLWRSSLLDPESYPLKETSGSGFYTFALAWGINHNLLDRDTYGPVVRKAWRSLVECVTPEGKLEHVQPIGADPKKFLPTDTEVYGPGAFLLAGREVYQLAGGSIPSTK